MILVEIGQYDYIPDSVSIQVENEGLNGMISSEKLWTLMKEKKVSQYMLIKDYHVSPAQITRLKRNESVSTHTVEMFCRILSCRVEDIMEYIPDE